MLLLGDLQPDPAYLEGSEFLRSLGMTNQAEIARVLDIATNPDSLFLSERDRQISSASVAANLVGRDFLSMPRQED